MSELLLELYSEEIPSLIQKKFVKIIEKKLLDLFKASKLQYSSIKSFVGPCRFIFIIQDLDYQILNKSEEIKGPKINSGDKAIKGFCKSYNINENKLEIKLFSSGKHYIYNKLFKNIPIKKSLEEKLPILLSNIIFPKSTSWDMSNVKWIRPLRNILCILNGKTVNFKFGNLKSNNKTIGHKFLNNKYIKIICFKEYYDNLKKQHVIIDHEERKRIIIESAKEISSKINCTANIDNILLEEISGLVEYPVTLLGKINKEFLELPNEFLTIAINSHQKYFTLTDNKGGLTPYFIFVANIPNNDQDIIKGNEKVLKARLQDALFFFKNDKKIKLIDRKDQLKKILVHEKLGNMYDKTQRVKKIIELIDNKPDIIKASEIYKCDLSTEIVTESPKLQGIAGYYYAKHNGFSDQISLAIKEHYKPLGADDTIPSSYESQILSLSDKLDYIVMLHIAGEKATSSKDPLGLRRLAISIIRIIIEAKININIRDIIDQITQNNVKKQEEREKISSSIILFIEERLKYYLNKKYNTNHINCFINLNKQLSIFKQYQKLKSISPILLSEKGQNIIKIYKRISTILDIQIDYKLKPEKLNTKEEIKLFKSISEVKKTINNLINVNDYDKAFIEIENLAPYINSLFENLLINTENKESSENRKSLLKEVMNLFKLFGNFENL